MSVAQSQLVLMAARDVNFTSRARALSVDGTGNTSREGRRMSRQADGR